MYDYYNITNSGIICALNNLKQMFTTLFMILNPTWGPHVNIPTQSHDSTWYHNYIYKYFNEFCIGKGLINSVIGLYYFYLTI